MRVPAESVASRVPAIVKLALTLCVILGLGALPAEHAWWGLGLLLPLAFVARAARISFRSLLKRLWLALPLVLGGAALALFQARGSVIFGALLVKSSLSLLVLGALVESTSSVELLRALQRAGLPETLASTVFLLHRYLFLFSDEATRMRRARQSRTFRASRAEEWRARAGTIGFLFVRSVARAERVHAAMRARGAE